MAEDNPKQSTEAEEGDIPEAVAESMAAAERGAEERDRGVSGESEADAQDLEAELAAAQDAALRAQADAMNVQRDLSKKSTRRGNFAWSVFVAICWVSWITSSGRWSPRVTQAATRC